LRCSSSAQVVALSRVNCHASKKCCMHKPRQRAGWSQCKHLLTDTPLSLPHGFARQVHAQRAVLHDHAEMGSPIFTHEPFFPAGRGTLRTLPLSQVRALVALANSPHAVPAWWTDSSTLGIGLIAEQRFEPSTLLVLELDGEAGGSMRLLLARVRHATPWGPIAGSWAANSAAS